MKIYLAARYSRRLELCGYREELQAMGHEVTSRWLDGQHQVSDDGVPVGETGEALIEGDDGSTGARAAALRARFALEDQADVQACDLLIAFTESPRSTATRGGRHVELGLALGMGKRILVVGPRENIFCWLPSVAHFEHWQSALSLLELAVRDDLDYAHERVVTVRMPHSLHKALLDRAHYRRTSLNRHCVDMLRGSAP